MINYSLSPQIMGNVREILQKYTFLININEVSAMGKLCKSLNKVTFCINDQHSLSNHGFCKSPTLKYHHYTHMI